MKVLFNQQLIADSNKTEVVEGNHYFPPEAIRQEFFKESSTHTTCPWKGQASYYSLEVAGEKASDAAWYYPEPKQAAQNIKGYVAFYSHKVQITE
ncbi:DUF427 domain-containing protein [Catalinimonas niigatensis]|uniref:DUF427 domain-containing protein n=1 Tax=Catalinimonas niigatensis TaxID=1397264 RepID=UPI0026663075|nr:DUF427 domain-containing protein [Catalinimonas niigatensis]WPP49241.1 DUF427 domain-containing protein [Catalinimonas niigatensis]